MEQKEIRLNASKRKSLKDDFRKHCENQDSNVKEEFLEAREVAKDTICLLYTSPSPRDS